MSNLVEPIRTRSELNAIKSHLKCKNKTIYLIFMIGISSALRISDILKMKKKNFYTERGKMRKEIEIIEKKTKKVKKFPITSNLETALIEYFKNKKNIGYNDYLFLNKKTQKPITRQYVSKVIIAVKEDLEIQYNFNTHSFRKTWGYWAYKSGYDIMLIMDALNHSSPYQTKKYIGLRQEDLNEMYINLNL